MRSNGLRYSARDFADLCSCAGSSQPAACANPAQSADAAVRQQQHRVHARSMTTARVQLACRACRPLSLDDSVRLVTLSIEDPVKLIEGRRMAPRPAQPRWMDAYHLPGQQVVVQMGGAKLKAALASAPTEVHQRSAELDACICEVAVAQRDGAQPLFEAEPGAQAEVSDIHGIGFASPSDPQKTLMRALEVCRSRCLRMQLTACGDRRRRAHDVQFQ